MISRKISSQFKARNTLPIKLIAIISVIIIIIQASAIALTMRVPSQVSGGLTGQDLTGQVLSILNLIDSEKFDSTQLGLLSNTLIYNGAHIELSATPLVTKDSELSSSTYKLKQSILNQVSQVYIRETIDELSPDFSVIDSELIILPASEIPISQTKGLSGENENIIFTDTAGFAPEVAFQFHRTQMLELSIQLGDERWLNFSTTTIKSYPSSILYFMPLMLGACLIVVIVSFCMLPFFRTIQSLKFAFREFDPSRNSVLIPESGNGQIGEVISAFNLFSRQSQKIFLEQNDMFNAVSHDLLTPISSLRIRSEFIKDKQLKKDISITLDNMEHLTKSILEAARGGRCEEEKRIIDISSLISSIAEDGNNMGKYIKTGELPFVKCNGRPSELRRMLDNLIENALRYSDEVTISIEIGRENFNIFVDDTGPGIPESDHERILKPFTRLEKSRNTTTGGFGLGLTITNAIVTRHNGKLQLKNRNPHGLRVKISLPIHQ